MISGNGATADYAQFRPQQVPADTAARELYTLQASQEPRLAHRVTHVANKPSEVNAFNMPYSPSMIVRIHPAQKHSLQTFRILSAPIKLMNLTGLG